MTPPFTTPTLRRGFTLVELLVVIAVVALLIGVLLPALAGARAASYQIKDASLQKQLMVGVQVWSNEHDLEIPGLNTSGLRVYDINTSGDDEKLDKASRPTQNFDWLSLALDDTQLPDDRSERFVYIFNQFVNPANRTVLSPTDLQYGSVGDLQAFMEGDGGRSAQTVNAPSYFMGAPWQWAGPISTGAATNIDGERYEQPSGEQNVALLPSNWFPRATNVGSASDKVAISNAVYNLDPTEKLDASIWVEPDEDEYGAFCSSTPCKRDSINFETSIQSSDIDRSYPHGGKINAGYWDGHVATLSPQESQDPGLWFPRGSILGDEATDLAKDLYTPNVDRIN